MFERFLKRLSKSKYAGNFILKGGFLIGSMIGIENRSTRDLDATMIHFDLDKMSFEKVFNEICQLESDDEVKFELQNIVHIRESSQDTGLRISFDGILQKTRIHLKLDVTLGDVIVPDAIQYSHPCLFSEEVIKIMSYSTETILAEKIESILSWGLLGKRMRDYYDVYVLLHNEFDASILKDALLSTTTHRGSLQQLHDYSSILPMIRKDASLQVEWLKYQTAQSYSQNIEFASIIELLIETLENVIK